MKISYILLAHEPLECIAPLVSTLLAQGSNVYLHYDLKTKVAIDSVLALNELGFPGKLFLAKRCLVKWGEWSIAKASLNCLRDIDFHADDSDYFMLISGSCFPIKSYEVLQAFLTINQRDFIECFDATKNRWVTGGIQNDRWDRYHFFNYRFQRKRFAVSLYLQKKFRIMRSLPQGLAPHIGSQWWCLRSQTIQRILNFLILYPEIERFFSFTCIPDESFFQTIVANLIPSHQISGQHLTEYRFNSWGVPRVYYDDDFRELVRSPFYFARKIDYGSLDLRDRLMSLYSKCSLNNNHAALKGKEFIGTSCEYSKSQFLYGASSQTPALGLLSVHYCHNINNKIILLAAPDTCIRDYFSLWLERQVSLVYVRPPETPHPLSLFQSLHHASNSHPEKLLLVSIAGWSLEIHALCNAKFNIKLLILPANLSAFACFSSASSFYDEFIGDLAESIPQSLMEGSINLFHDSPRNYRFGVKNYLSCPLFNNLIF